MAVLLAVPEERVRPVRDRDDLRGDALGAVYWGERLRVCGPRHGLVVVFGVVVFLHGDPDEVDSWERVGCQPTAVVC